MGRNIFRRTSLIVLLTIAGHLYGVSHSTSDPLPSRLHEVQPSDNIRDSSYIEPRQNHAAEKAWSLGVIETSHDTVFDQIEFWSSSTGLKRLLIARERYFPFRSPVNSILRSSGLPWELVAIPVVESNWRLNAVSSSGAAGPWQFLISSARGRNLVIDAWRDERRDVWRSTRAAVDEISFYHRMFGDWLMVLASYNAGPTRMKKLVNDSGISNYWELLDNGLLPEETEAYVPKIIAVAYLMSHAGRLGLPLTWEKPTGWSRIPTDRAVHLESFARAIGANTSEILMAHSELNHPITPPPDRHYTLKIPADFADKARKHLEEMNDHELPKHFWRYVVHSGDTFSGIADKFGISQRDLLSYNGHINPDVLGIGERLYLPGGEDRPLGVKSYDLPRWVNRYMVKPGDTLWSISRRFRIEPELLAEVNHRSLNKILRVGSILFVPGRREEE